MKTLKVTDLKTEASDIRDNRIALLQNNDKPSNPYLENRVMKSEIKKENDDHDEGYSWSLTNDNDLNAEEKDANEHSSDDDLHHEKYSCLEVKQPSASLTAIKDPFEIHQRPSINLSENT